MIKKATRFDKADIMKVWSTCFPYEDIGYTQYFFDTYYKNENTIVFKNDTTVIGSLQMIPFNVMLNHRYLKSSMIVGVDVMAMYRHQGIMTQMMNQALNIKEHTELVTLIQTEDESLYIPFGFEKIFVKKEFLLNTNDAINVNNTGISHRFRVEDMLELYGAFMKHFDGFHVRGIDDMKNMINGVYAQNGDLVLYYDHGNQLQGYAFITFQDNQAVIEEIVYMDSIGLCKLINYALSLRNSVKVKVSKAENLKKIYPRSLASDGVITMARINDYELFNRLYSCEVDSVKKAYELSLLPTNIIELL